MINLRIAYNDLVNRTPSEINGSYDKSEPGEMAIASSNSVWIPLANELIQKGYAVVERLEYTGKHQGTLIHLRHTGKEWAE